jgi:hypothetical protein
MPTPNIDRLAHEGMRFFYWCPITSMLSKAEPRGRSNSGSAGDRHGRPRQALPLNDDQGKAAFDEQRLAPLF